MPYFMMSFFLFVRSGLLRRPCAQRLSKRCAAPVFAVVSPIHGGDRAIQTLDGACLRLASTTGEARGEAPRDMLWRNASATLFARAGPAKGRK